MFDCLQRRRIHGSKILHIRHHEMCSVLFIYDFVAFFLIILRLRRCILLRLIKKDQITDEYQEIELWRQHHQKTKTMFNSIWLNNSQVLSNSEYCRLLGIDNYKQYFTYTTSKLVKIQFQEQLRNKHSVLIIKQMKIRSSKHTFILHYGTLIQIKLFLKILKKQIVCTRVLIQFTFLMFCL